MYLNKENNHKLKSYDNYLTHCNWVARDTNQCVRNGVVIYK